MAYKKIDSPVTMEQVRKFDDDKFKQFVIESIMVHMSPIRERFRHFPDLVIRTYNLLAYDKEFQKNYEDALTSYVRNAEEQLLTGHFLTEIPQTVDKLGNVDLARGHLKLAEMQMKRMQWLLERRDRKYQTKSDLQDAVEAGAKITIEMPAKESDEPDV